MTTGDLLADCAKDVEAVAAWREARGLADVMPFAPIAPPDHEAYELPGEQEFYAGKLGTTVERWRPRAGACRRPAGWLDALSRRFHQRAVAGGRDGKTDRGSRRTQCSPSRKSRI